MIVNDCKIAPGLAGGCKHRAKSVAQHIWNEKRTFENGFTAAPNNDDAQSLAKPQLLLKVLNHVNTKNTVAPVPLLANLAPCFRGE